MSTLTQKVKEKEWSEVLVKRDTAKKTGSGGGNNKQRAGCSKILGSITELNSRAGCSKILGSKPEKNSCAGCSKILGLKPEKNSYAGCSKILGSKPDKNSRTGCSKILGLKPRSPLGPEDVNLRVNLAARKITSTRVLHLAVALPSSPLL
uniref:(California timema) hypothetical protein n=1 Tax=Timema californicum TaxID=61474 RepID=A0A7R9P735_TIMCA|nr:unnamed protein product [Timema californicum]